MILFYTNTSQSISINFANHKYKLFGVYTNTFSGVVFEFFFARFKINNYFLNEEKNIFILLYCIRLSFDLIFCPVLISANTDSYKPLNCTKIVSLNTPKIYK